MLGFSAVVGPRGCCCRSLWLAALRRGPEEAAGRKEAAAAYLRGREDALSLLRSPRRQRMRRWLFNVSVMLLTCGFLKLCYSLSSLLLPFPRPPDRPFRLFFNKREWLAPKESKLTFEDVVGCAEAKQELQAVVRALARPDSFSRVGARLPRGVLLVGPPGVGKTHLGRAVAGEADATFLHVNGSELDGGLVGDGARKLRELFSFARAKAPSVVFLDDIDCLCPARSELPDSRTHTANQLLVEMDGLRSANRKGRPVVVLGATSRPDALDAALRRAGRFDTVVHLRKPNVDERAALFCHFLTDVAVGTVKPGLDRRLAALSAGLTGADIANAVNRAAILAGVSRQEVVSEKNILTAVGEAQWGLERRDVVCNDEERHARAVHEAGHAILSRFTKHAPILCRVSILPGKDPHHGRTCLLPDEADSRHTRAQLSARLDVLLGGRVAEEELLGLEKVSCTESDLQQASEIAASMVRQFGVKGGVGVPLLLTGDEESRPSDSSLAQADAEISRLLQESRTRVRGILHARMKETHRVIAALERFGTLDSEDLSAVLIGGIPKAGEERESDAERLMTRWSNF